MLDKLEKILKEYNVFLSGGAGVGKSFLVKELKNSYEKQNKKVITLGSSALSALNVGGVTLHSFFCFGHCANLKELSLYDRNQKQKLAKLGKILKKLDLIIIDEISMVSAELFDMIEFRIRTFDFKGKFLVVGDFFQLPPVVKEKQNSLFVTSYYAFSSLFWQSLAFKNLSLSVSKRTQNSQFYEKLSLLREGILNDELLEYFKNFIFKPKNLEEIDDFTLLCGINKKADFINEQRLHRINNPLFLFKAEFKKDDEGLSKAQFDSWVKGLNITRELKLKVGARVIFTLNNVDKGYFNGEQGVIDEIIEQEDKKCIKIIKNNGSKIMLEPYTYLLEEFEQVGEEIFVNVRASVSQFPIKLAYAITIHKSQGMSIEKLVCDIDHIFENGQLYVALSRATNPTNLKILYSKDLNFKTYFVNVLKIDESVKNFYKENEFLDLEKEEK
ncbi:MAG: AAA family ATPase [Campylobacter sp.]|nr:AAA family ATPase [Campylobacter sp.]